MTVLTAYDLKPSMTTSVTLMLTGAAVCVAVLLLVLLRGVVSRCLASGAFGELPLRIV